MNHRSQRISVIALASAILAIAFWGSPLSAQVNRGEGSVQSAQASVDTVVVCPDVFRQALEPWVEYRTRQGHRIVVVPSHSEASVVQASLQPFQNSGKLSSILLIGDVPPRLPVARPLEVQGPQNGRQAELAARWARRFVPTFHVPAKVNVKFGSEPEIASDLGYADVDDDHVPDFALGRLPVDTPDQLTRWIERLIAYENRRTTDYSGRRVGIVASPGDFGALADSVLEMTAKKFIQAGIPSAYEIDTIYMNANSPYCPDPTRLPQTTLNQLNQGSLFWVYIGHGQSWYLAPMLHDSTWFPSFDTRYATQLDCQSQPPIAVFFACYTGAFDGEHDCLAEEMTLADGGPIAALSASRVAMPYAMSVMADALLGEHFQNRPETLGQLVLNAKRATLKPIEDQSDRRVWLHSLAKLFSPTRDELQTEVFENSAVFNLIGDPLLRLPKPETVVMEVPQRVPAGESLRIRGRLPKPGRVTLELVYRRDRQLWPASAKTDAPEKLGRWQDDYRNANELTCRYEVVDLPAGEFDRELYVPMFARGACHVRVYSQQSSGFALGSTDVYVEPYREPTRLTRRNRPSLDRP